MNYQKVIEYKLQMLIDIMLTDGVSPSELSNNIFEKEYISISFKKEKDYIIGKLHFYENDNILNGIYMVYTYTLDKKLVKIEEIVNGEMHILWDRRRREEELIEEILFFMNYCYDNQQMRDFILSLPPALMRKVQDYLTSLSA